MYTRKTKTRNEIYTIKPISSVGFYLNAFLIELQIPFFFFWEEVMLESDGAFPVDDVDCWEACVTALGLTDPPCSASALSLRPPLMHRDCLVFEHWRNLNMKGLTEWIGERHRWSEMRGMQQIWFRVRWVDESHLLRREFRYPMGYHLWFLP